jgi:hypothetical protein
VIVGNVFDLLADRKLRHRKLLFGFVDAIISPRAGRRFLTMYLPEFRTMVVALLPHPALGREPLYTWNAKRTSRDVRIESEMRFETKSVGQSEFCGFVALALRVCPICRMGGAPCPP